MVYVEIDEEHIEIGDDRGEIVYWDRAEWIEVPDLALVIAGAIKILYEEGGDALRKKLRHLYAVR